MSKGASTVKTLRASTGFGTKELGSCLSNLAYMDLVHKNGIFYKVQDKFFEFWLDNVYSLKQDSEVDDLDVKYLEFMNGIVAATRLEGPEQIEAAEDWDDELSTFFDNASLLTKVRYVFTSLLIPAVGAAVQAEHRNEALRRAAVARIALQRYRLAHGKLPEMLQQLVPEFLDRLPSDPFDGKPLRYVVRDGEPIIYSIGADRTDDGGQGDASFEPDILFPIPAEEEGDF